MRVVAAGAAYFAVVFAVGWVLGPLRELVIVPRLGRFAGVVMEAPLMLAASLVAARWIVRRLAVPRALDTRLAMGGVAFALLMAAELLGARWLRGLSFAEYLARFGTPAGLVSLLLFLLFAVMPALVPRTPPPRP